MRSCPHRKAAQMPPRTSSAKPAAATPASETAIPPDGAVRRYICVGARIDILRASRRHCYIRGFQIRSLHRHHVPSGISPDHLVDSSRYLVHIEMPFPLWLRWKMLDVPHRRAMRSTALTDPTVQVLRWEAVLHWRVLPDAPEPWGSSLLTRRDPER